MAVLKQERHVELVSTAAEAFVITSQMVSAAIPAELPHVNVFVISIIDVTDPKQDTLARVAMLADLSTIPIGRDPGIANPGPNGLEYLSATTVNIYGDLQTAIAAAQAIQDQVNTLILNWIAFDTTFSAPDPSAALYTFPRVDSSQKTALINAYAAVKQSRYQLGLGSTAASTAVTAAQAALTYKQSLVTQIGSIAGTAGTVSSNFGLVVAQFGALLSAGQGFYVDNTGSPAAPVFNGALNLAIGQQGAMSGFTATAAGLTSSIVTFVSARNADVTTASTALSAAQSAQISALATYTAAQAAEAAALQAVLAVCPDFAESSIPLVPSP